MIKKLSIKVVIAIIISFLMYFVIKDLYASAFFQKRDRINIVVTTDRIGVYSIGKSDNVNYYINFYPDMEVVVPGGFGFYRLGALAKLAGLEKKPEIIKKAYSSTISSFVDFYFYPNSSAENTKILFGKKNSFFLPSFKLIFFSKTNAQFFDRIYLYLQFLGKTQGNFKILDNFPSEDLGNTELFLAEEYFRNQQGILYQKTYRSEQRNVQIVYTESYKTAQLLARILEGEGIRVVDLNQSKKGSGECEIIEDTKKFSKTAKSIVEFFGCQMSVGNTGAYDIIFKLGRVEKEWEVE